MKKLYVDLTALSENSDRRTATAAPTRRPAFYLYDNAGALIGSGHNVAVTGANGQNVSVAGIDGGLRKGGSLAREVIGCPLVIELDDAATVNFNA